MAAHAKLSASGSKRWLTCAASVQAESGLKDSSSVYAKEGTAAHTLGEMCLDQGKMAIDFLGTVIEAEGDKFTVDEEMASAVQVYIDYCNNIPAFISMREKRVCFDKWVPEGFGTSDFIGIQYDGALRRQIIHVVDLKYGKGVMVDALDNSQGMLYGLGTIQTLGFIYDFQEHDIVKIAIVQPRKDHISEFSITVGDLLRWADRTVVPAVKKALGPNPTYTPGDEQCKWCKAKPTCKALADENFKMVFEDFSALPAEGLEPKKKEALSMEEIGMIMQKIPMLVDWAKSVEAFAFDQINRGVHIPGYKLVQGKKGNRAWKDEKETISKLKELDLKESEFSVFKLKTPPAIEKICKAKKIDLEQVSPLWTQPDGKPTIAPESDKRKPIKAEVDRDFSVIKQEA